MNTPAPSRPEDLTAGVIAAAAMLFATIGWVIAAVALVRGRRGAPVIQGPETPAWLTAWHVAGLLALFPMAGTHAMAAAPAVAIARALGGAIAVWCGALLLTWETATRRRYLDRSITVATRARFLTYGPYARVRRPQDLALTLLIVGTSFVLPGWWRPAIALAVFGSSMAVRARRTDDAIARVAGEEYALYQGVTPLLLPGRTTRAPRATA